jgi:hypothetical protein
MDYIIFTFSLLLSYQFNNSLSKKGHRINKRLPSIKIKFLQLSPNIKIHFKNRSIHIHHWLTYSVMLIIAFTLNTGIFESFLSRGYLVGGILQGLSFPDWKKIIIQKD